MKLYKNRSLFTISLIAIICLLTSIFGWNVYNFISVRQPKSSASPSTAYPTSLNNTDKAIMLLENIPEIQTIEKSVVRTGRKPFFTPEGENGDTATVSLRESFPDDPHTSRIDTFNVNIKSKVITVEDVVSGQDISFAQWKKTVRERFP